MVNRHNRYTGHALTSESFHQPSTDSDSLRRREDLLDRLLWRVVAESRWLSALPEVKQQNIRSHRVYLVISFINVLT